MKFCIIIELLKYLQLKCKILYYDCAIEIYQRSVFFLLRLLINHVLINNLRLFTENKRNRFLVVL